MTHPAGTYYLVMQKRKEGWVPFEPPAYADAVAPLGVVRLQNERFPGWVFTVQFGQMGEVIGFAIDESDWRADEREPLNASFVHGIGVGAAIARARAIALMTARAATLVTERISPAEAKVLYDREGRAILRSDLLADLAQWAALVSERTGTRGKDDVVFARVADEYVRLVEGGERAPLQRLAETLNFSASRVRNVVYEARKRRLLTATRPGVKGGRLTAKGRRVLATPTAEVAHATGHAYDATVITTGGEEV